MFFPLLGDAEPGGWRDFVMVLGPIVSGVVVWVATELRKGKQQQRADRIEDEKTAIGYYKDVIERLQQQHAECEERQEKQAERLQRVELKQARWEVYTEGLEQILDNAKVSYRKWRDTPAQLPPSSIPPPGQVNP